MTSNTASSPEPEKRRPPLMDVGPYRDHQFNIFATSHPSWCREYAGEFLKSLPPITQEDDTAATLLIYAIGRDEFLKSIDQSRRAPLDKVVLRQVDPAAENIAELQRKACIHAIQRNTNLVMFEDISEPAASLPLECVRVLFQTSHHLAFGLSVKDDLGLFEEVFIKLGISISDLRILMRRGVQPFQLFYNGLNYTEALDRWIRADLQMLA
jgi:hypothetical protein